MTTPRCGGGGRFYCRHEGEYSQRHLRVQTELEEAGWGAERKGTERGPREGKRVHGPGQSAAKMAELFSEEKPEEGKPSPWEEEV